MTHPLCHGCVVQYDLDCDHPIGAIFILGGIEGVVPLRGMQHPPIMVILYPVEFQHLVHWTHRGPC